MRYFSGLRTNQELSLLSELKRNPFRLTTMKLFHRKDGYLPDVLRLGMGCKNLSSGDDRLAFFWISFSNVNRSTARAASTIGSRSHQ
jgi:hypothetical protein